MPQAQPFPVFHPGLERLLRLEAPNLRRGATLFSPESNSRIAARAIAFAAGYALTCPRLNPRDVRRSRPRGASGGSWEGANYLETIRRMRILTAWARRYRVVFRRQCSDGSHR